MKDEKKIFTREERAILRGILRGTLGEMKGTPIQYFSRKIEQELDKMKFYCGRKTVVQVVHWLTNNQPVWNAIYLVVKTERPGSFESLQKSIYKIDIVRDRRSIQVQITE